VRAFTALAATLLLSLQPAAAWAADDTAAGDAERIAGPLPRFFPRLDSYLELPEDRRSHFRLAYVIGSDGGAPPEDIRMWYEHDGETRPFGIDETGRIAHLPGIEALAAEPDVWINQPNDGEARFSLTMQFEYGRPLAERYAREDLERGIEQANQAIRQAAGVAALFAPSMKTVVFIFDGAAPEAWAIDDAGERTPLTVQENRAFFRPGDRSNRSVEQLEFGRAPQRVLLDS